MVDPMPTLPSTTHREEEKEESETTKYRQQGDAGFAIPAYVTVSWRLGLCWSSRSNHTPRNKPQHVSAVAQGALRHVLELRLVPHTPSGYLIHQSRLYIRPTSREDPLAIKEGKIRSSQMSTRTGFPSTPFLPHDLASLVQADTPERIASPSSPHQ